VRPSTARCDEEYWVWRPALIDERKKGIMNQEKIRRAAAATDVILQGVNAALQALQAPTWTNGAGVLSDPSMARSNLHRARDAIDMALDAMNSLDGWPREQDYE
jgi:hypothetical protein